MTDFGGLSPPSSNIFRLDEFITTYLPKEKKVKVRFCQYTLFFIRIKSIRILRLKIAKI